jgi:peptide/nickel transport system substrate-binding protein
MLQGFARIGTGAVATRPAADGGSGDGGSGSSVTVTPLTRWRRYVRCSVGAAVVLAGLVLSACGSGTADQAAGQPGSLRSFTVALPSQPSALDGVTVAGSGSLQIISLVNDVPVVSGPACKLIPQLATSISYPDPKTLVFHLRKGVRFSNGEPVTAEDVAWSIARAFSPISFIHGTGYPYKGVSIIGPQEVALHLTRPTPAVACTTSFMFFVGSKKYALRHGKDYGTPAAPPIGTGPYKVAKFDANGVTLVRNPYYWGPKPPVQTIRFVGIGDDNTAQLAMRSNQIQADYAISNPQTLGAWKAIPGAKVVVAQGSTSDYISMDVTKAPFNDIHVRKAVAYAVDKHGLANSVAPGYATPLKAFTVAYGFESVAPSHEAAEQFIDTLPQYDFDLAKAKAELAQSAYPHGFTMRLPYQAGSTAAELTALSLKQNLQSIGIKVQLKSLPAAQFYNGSGMASAHPGMQIVIGWTTMPEDPGSGLAGVIGRRASAAHHDKATYGGNLANFYPPNVQRASDQINYQVGNAARWQGVQTALRAIATEVPYVPIMNLPQLVVLGGGLSFNGPLSVMDMISNQWIYKLR